jgi:hypothetical protein
MLGFLVLEWPAQRRAIRILFAGMAGAGMLGVLLSAHPLAVFVDAWRRGAAYGAFFLALGALRDAAETSPTVRRCGEHLVAQPPGRRYAALTAGGHLFGVILSYGAIELLGAMVARANTLASAGGDALVQAARGRRMLMAVYRGFACMNCWSPLNIMTAVVSAAVPAADLRPLLPVAFAVAVGMMAIGWAMDRLGHADEGDAPASGEDWAIHLRVVGLVALVMALAEATSAWFRVGMATGVTLSVPVVGLAWVAAQLWRRGRTGELLLRRLGRFRRRLPQFRGEATVLASAGFFGVALGAALPAGGLAFLAQGAPALIVPLAVPALLLATGLLGLNPIAVIAVVGAAVPDPRAVGVAPAVLAFACMLGWGVAVGMTPMSASAITTARWTRSDPWTVSVVWNGRYTLWVLLLAWAAIAAAHLLWSPA